MAREATPLVVPDLSTFARSLSRALKTQQPRSEPLGHLHLQNLIARAAGYRNLQALKATAARMPRGDRAADLSDAARAGHQHSIEVSGSVRIELVNAIRQECTDFFAFGIISGSNDFSSHDT